MSDHVVYGIRHHGPGSARSLLRALEKMHPDAVLIEGPSDAEPLIALAAHEEMRPPVALLVYDPQMPRRCAFYPFAEFSPEWQAMRYALARNIPIRFMDLPQSHLLALRQQAEEEAAQKDARNEEEPEDETESGDDPLADARRDPLGLLASAAGYSDSERWWEHLVEERHDSDDVFAAIGEAMTALRLELNGAGAQCDCEEETRREAWMRNTIRRAKKEGFERIAVVCGAWHAPALTDMPSAKQDDAILKGLPKLKTQAAWIPWTYGRLARHSGYGAGVVSPGWYDFLWNARARADRDGANGQAARDLSAGWLAQVAALLREKGLDVSTAHVIEAVRLAESLAILRGRPIPGLIELNEAVQTVVLMGDATALTLVHEELIVGERMGEVPSDAPLIPLQQDLQRLQKSLRLLASADTKDYDLDLRKPNDLERSQLLHRLHLLDIGWGEIIGSAVRSKGTFREAWRLQWQPEFSIKLIEAGIWGNTVESAATARAMAKADESSNFAALTMLVNAVLLADLADAIHHLMTRIEAEAAVAADVANMMDALPPLAGVMRYGNVRGAGVDTLAHVVTGLVARICIGLVDACYSLDDDAARAMLERVVRMNGAIRTIENPEFVRQWLGALSKLVKCAGLHGLVAGCAMRLLLDCSEMPPDEAGRRMGLALSRGNDTLQAGAWIEGFLQGSGMVLLHTDALWSIVDEWVCGLGEEAFVEVLPLLRRTFARFPAPERRMMGERVKRDSRSNVRAMQQDTPDDSIDEARAQRVLPILEMLLDLEAE